MRSTNSSSPGAAAILVLGRRIAAPEPRRLFAAFCREVSRFSDSMRTEVAPFDITFRDAADFSITVSPLRDLFIVSLGEDRSSDIRVSSRESFCFALDSALRRRLAATAGGESARGLPIDPARSE